MQDLLRKKLEQKFPVSLTVFREELTVGVPVASLTDVCRFLRDDPELRFDSLRDLCGMETARPGERFGIVINLWSTPNRCRLRLKVFIPGQEPHVPTITGIWPAANWPEREAYDMYGIIFDGHPDLRRMYLPEEFEYYPLRKDFPLMGIPGSLPLPRK